MSINKLHTSEDFLKVLLWNKSMNFPESEGGQGRETRTFPEEGDKRKAPTLMAWGFFDWRILNLKSS
jgi:hypothetical protein